MIARREREKTDKEYSMSGQIDCQACEHRAKRDGTEIPDPPTGGQITGRIPFRGELRQQVDVFQPVAPGLAALSARIKNSFDPRGVLNPGRMHGAY